MLIAQLSDSHIRVGPLAGEAASHLHRALGRVLGLHPVPDCVVITGDVVENGAAAEYEAFRSIVDGYPLPIHLAAGNHDDGRTMVEIFGRMPFLGGGDSTYYAVTYSEARLVVLDSTVPGSMAGHLDDSQLDWLDGTLAADADTPALVCMHHPPVDVGIPFLDSIKLDNPDALGSVIGKHQNVRRILAGHVHRAITASFAGTTVTIAPSTYRQATLDLRNEAPSGYVHEPPGFLLHLMTPANGITHLVPTMQASGSGGLY